MKKIVLGLCASAVILSACVNPERVPMRQAGDNSLTCAAITSELTHLDTIRAKAAKGTGFSAENVIAFLLFWPAVLVNVGLSATAEGAANDREGVLADLAQKQNCQL